MSESLNVPIALRWATLAIAGGTICGCNPICPKGYYQIDDTCYRIKDAGVLVDGGEPAIVESDGSSDERWTHRY